MGPEGAGFDDGADFDEDAFQYEEVVIEDEDEADADLELALRTVRQLSTTARPEAAGAGEASVPERAVTPAPGEASRRPEARACPTAGCSLQR